MNIERETATSIALYSNDTNLTTNLEDDDGTREKWSAAGESEGKGVGGEGSPAVHDLELR